MSEQNVPSRFSRIAAVALGVAALSLVLAPAAHADGDHHGKRHGKHSGNYYEEDDDYGYYGPPPVYYGGPPPCRGPKHVKVYNYYPVPVAVPVVVPVQVQAYPAYPTYPSSGSNVLVRVGVDWVFGF